jgi:hypothetical protein
VQSRLATPPLQKPTLAANFIKKCIFWKKFTSSRMKAQTLSLRMRRSFRINKRDSN